MSVDLKKEPSLPLLKYLVAFIYLLSLTLSPIQSRAQGNRANYLKAKAKKLSEKLQTIQPQPFGEKCDLQEPNGDQKCSAFFSQIIGTSDFRGVFTRFAGEFSEDSPWGICSSTTQNTRHIATAQDLEQSYLNNPEFSLDNKSAIDSNSSCFENQSETYKKALIAEYYTSGNRLKSNFEHSVRTIAEIDSTIGKTTLEGVGCDFPLETQKNYCNQLKKDCKPPRSTGEKVRDLEKKLSQLKGRRFNAGPSGLKAKKAHQEKLDKIKAELDSLNAQPPNRTEKMQVQIKKTMGVLNQIHSLQLEIGAIRSKTLRCDNKQSCKNKIKEIREKINIISTQAPWVQGEQFKKYLDSYKASYKELAEKGGLQVPPAPAALKALAKAEGILELAISKQLLESRKQLLSRLEPTKKSMNCLLGQHDAGVRSRNACSEGSYNKALLSSPAFTPYEESQIDPVSLAKTDIGLKKERENKLALNEYSEKAQCIRQKVDTRNGNDLFVGELAVGAALSLLPFGQIALLRIGTLGLKGLSRTAGQVAKSLHTRNIILGSDIAFSTYSAGSAAVSCEKQMAKVSNPESAQDGRFSCPGDYTDDELESSEATAGCLSTAIMAGIPFVGYGFTAKAFTKLNKIGAQGLKEQLIEQTNQKIKQQISKNTTEVRGKSTSGAIEDVSDTQIEAFHQKIAEAPIEDKVKVAEDLLELNKNQSNQLKAILEDRTLENLNPLIEQNAKLNSLKSQGWNEDQILALNQTQVLTRKTPLDGVAPAVPIKSVDDIVVGQNIYSKGENVIVGPNEIGVIKGYGKKPNTLLVQIGKPGRETLKEVPLQELTKPLKEGDTYLLNGEIAKVTNRNKDGSYNFVVGKNSSIKRASIKDLKQLDGEPFQPELAGDPYPLGPRQFIQNGRIWSEGDVVNIPNPDGPGTIFGRVQTPEKKIAKSNDLYAGQYIEASEDIPIHPLRDKIEGYSSVKVSSKKVKPALKQFEEVIFKNPTDQSPRYGDIFEIDYRKKKALVQHCPKKNKCDQLWVDIDQLTPTGKKGALLLPSQTPSNRFDEILVSGKYGTNRRLVVQRFAAMDEVARRQSIESIFPDLTPSQVDAAMAAHNVKGAGVWQYTIKEQAKKRKLMNRAGISRADQDLLMDLGLAGKTPDGMNLQRNEFLVRDTIIEADSLVEVRLPDGSNFRGNIKNGTFEGDLYIKPKDGKVLKINIDDAEIVRIGSRNGELGRPAMSDKSTKGQLAHTNALMEFKPQLKETIRAAREIYKLQQELNKLGQQIARRVPQIQNNQKGWDEFLKIQTQHKMLEEKIFSRRNQLNSRAYKLYERYLAQGGTYNPKDFMDELSTLAAAAPK